MSPKEDASQYNFNIAKSKLFVLMLYVQSAEKSVLKRYFHKQKSSDFFREACICGVLYRLDFGWVSPSEVRMKTDGDIYFGNLQN